MFRSGTIYLNFVLMSIIVGIVSPAPAPPTEMSLTPYLNKKYRLASTNEVEEMLRAMGFRNVSKKLLNVTMPVMELTEHDGEYTLRTTYAFKTVQVKFRMNQGYHEKTSDGRIVTTTFIEDNNKLIQVKEGKDGKKTKITLEFTPEKLTKIVEYDNIHNIHTYIVE